eukprot:CAMPEP_0115831706 /NCGR_PEP_ID=MMETSP0287-20121206/2278_1 /TAXON_ID=412157 /ORGANISM="Chrysochromulina rotalis, Strain UIO044" /LENGTH=216 /DNA_ID=CAMNT_0003285063 /DNA_START=99 /DNA_END=746 /DNA_ORIENTATION=+
MSNETTAMNALNPSTLPDRAGNQQTLVMEDVWLGSFLYRFPPSQPITLVTLLGSPGKKLHVDAWDLRLTRSAILIHNPNKASARLLALHSFMPSLHCSLPFELVCADKIRAAVPEEAGIAKLTRCAIEGLRPSAKPSALHQHQHGHTTPEQCCTVHGPGNQSCGAIFGSNRWTRPFVQAEQRIEAYARTCFMPLGRRAKAKVEARQQSVCKNKLAL